MTNLRYVSARNCNREYIYREAGYGRVIRQCIVKLLKRSTYHYSSHYGPARASVEHRPYEMPPESADHASRAFTRARSSPVVDEHGRWSGSAR